MLKTKTSYPNVEAMCRLCLAEDASVEIFPKEPLTQTLSIPMRIMTCAALDVAQTDGLPKVICTECRFQLEKSYYFRKRSQAADGKMRKHMRLLSVGKLSRVFEQNSDDELIDEMEFEDSMRFIREQEDERNLAMQKSIKKLVRGEMVEEIDQQMNGVRESIRSELHEEVSRQVREELRTEIEAELRTTIEAELRETLRDECKELVREELRAEVSKECRKKEVRTILSQLELFLRHKRIVKRLQESHPPSPGSAEKSSRRQKRAEMKDRKHEKALWRLSQKRKMARTRLHRKNQKLEIKAETESEKDTKHSKGESDEKPAEVDEEEEEPLQVVYTEGDESAYQEPEEAEAEDPTNVYTLIETAGNTSVGTAEEIDESESEEEDDEAMDETYDPQMDCLDTTTQDTTDDVETEPTSYEISDIGEIKFTVKEPHKRGEGAGLNELLPLADEDEDKNLLIFDIGGTTSMETFDMVQFVNLKSGVKNEMTTKRDKNITISTSSAFSGDANGTSEDGTDSKTTSCPVVYTGCVDQPALSRRSTDTVKTFQCHFCPIDFSTKNALTRHLNTHKKLEKRGVKYQCSECNLIVSCRSSLNRHMLIHTGQRPFACSLCGKSFTQREILKRHLQVHSGLRGYKCPHCERGFTQKVNLLTHVDTCHGDEPKIQLHACHLCPKRFNHASGLSRHLASHAGLAFQCTECERTFGDRSSIKRHIQKVHGANPTETGSVETTYNLPKTPKAGEQL